METKLWPSNYGKERASILNFTNELLRIDGGPITRARAKKMKQHYMGY